MQYIIGQKVRIRPDLEEKVTYAHNHEYSVRFISLMKPYKNRIATITEVYKYGYSIDLGNSQWIWSNGMLTHTIVTKRRPL